MLRFRIRPRPRKLSSLEGLGSGPQGRIKRMRKIVTGLMRHERLELPSGQADEARGYTERLIQIAMQHGDKHQPTMEMADYWLLEKDLVHKLFKVLVPRYQNYSSSYTQRWYLPSRYPGPGGKMAILELKGNPWPPVKPRQRDTKYLLSNVLLNAARHEFYAEKQSTSKQSDDETQKTTENQNDQSRSQDRVSQDETVTFSDLSSDKKVESSSDGACDDLSDVTAGVKNIDLKPS